jgi:hypothetical protein
MSTESPGSPEQVLPARRAWRDWILVAACAILLLALSEALWLWQTWPVRELLQSAPKTSSLGSPR